MVMASVALVVAGCSAPATRGVTTIKGAATTSTTTTGAPAPTTTPPAASAPWPSLVYAGPGVAVVGISPVDNGNQGTRPSQLYVSTDMVHWTEVTPPRAQVTQNGGYGYFERASFLNASTGWVTTWNPATIGVTIYRTGDGGRTWSAVSGGGHSGNAGATVLLQLLSPTTAFKETLEPTAPGMSLQVSTNDGQTWETVY